MEKIIFVSNRLPVKIRISNDNNIELEPSIGGLATGLKSVHEGKNSTWIGWCGILDEELTKENQQRIEETLKEKFKSIPIFLSNIELEKYYYGFSNNTIWPLFHYFTDNTKYENNSWECYKKVNTKYLEKLSDIINPGDMVWIHDYQLMLLPKLLKTRFPNLKIGFFLHIPFPSYEIFRLLPWREKILEGILGADLIGFHTYDYVRHFVSSARRILNYEYNLGLINVENRLVKVDVFPMGIDYNKYASARDRKNVQSEINEIIKTIQGTQVILSVDRLDYTKGIPERIKAYNVFLSNNPEYREKVTMILIVAPSRTRVDAYQDLLKEIEELVSHTNGSHGTMGWIPVRFFFRSFLFDSLVALYSVADVLLVTPLRDGMNLIAKEYIASHMDKKGMVVISETAGAASELGEAVIVNPNNTNEVALGIKTALEMPIVVQIEKNEIMHKRLKRYNIDSWANDFVEKLNSIKEIQNQHVSTRLTEKRKEKIITDYKKSAKRLILLDYDGTLIQFFKKPQEAKPDKDIINILTKLTDDKNNIVVIISGRDRNTLYNWFGKIQINLIASHGLWIRDCTKDKEWEMIEVLSNEWKEDIRPVMEVHTDRTPGSFIEEKDFSLAWHYRRCDPDLAAIRLGELKEALMELTRNLNIGILEGNKVIEVKDTTINKGRGASIWLNNDKWDFIIAIGDDWTDEDMFNILPEKSYSIRVGYHVSSAKYAIESPDKVRKLLNQFI